MEWLIDLCCRNEPGHLSDGTVRMVSRSFALQGTDGNREKEVNGFTPFI